MKWKSAYLRKKEAMKQKQYLDGTSKIIFAWLPIKLETGHVVWLEKVKVTYRVIEWAYKMEVHKYYYEIKHDE